MPPGPAAVARKEEVPRVRPEIIRVNAIEPEPSLVSYVADRIRQGSVVGMPTDTFYGLAVDPYNLHAVERVYEIKERGRHKPLSLLIESVEQAEELANELPDEFYLPGVHSSAPWVPRWTIAWMFTASVSRR